MARILLYTDLSPSRPWLFATVHANRALLAAHGLELGPFTPWACEPIPSHLPFWTPVPEGGVIPPPVLQDGNTLFEQLEAGRNVLLMAYSLNPEGHQSLARLLRRHPHGNKHDVHALFVVGRPACVLEQRYREAGGLLPDDTGQTLTDRCTTVSLLLQDAIREWGENRVTLLADVSDSPVAERRDELVRRLFTFLGCPSPHLLEHLPRHPLFLASSEARRLSWTPEVRENAWPPLNEGLFMEALRSTERDWSTAPVAPLALRKRLIREGEHDLRALEKLLGLQSGALACPDWLASQPEPAPAPLVGNPLPADKVQAFADALPSGVRATLRQRYAYDAHLLTPDQKALDAALSAQASAPGIAIGEPVPPVELTVLTMTYNQEAYIAECMEGVLAQKTTFAVLHLVLDHHSTDGTAAIVAAYAAKHPSIRPVLLSQRRHPENVMGLFLRCRTQYAALCDGDDYYTDPLKLQKQVNFLESRPHCALCFHPVRVVYENDACPAETYPPLSMLPRGVREEYYLADMLQVNMIQTNSVVYRWRFRDGLPDWFRPDLCPGDWYWHLLHAEKGKIGFLPDAMSVYRRHRNALYATSSVSPLEHRRLHGMAELATYQAVNQHFEKRYFRRVADLANGVFANFAEIFKKEGDDTLLKQASEAYPDFARYFLGSLNAIHTKPPAPGEETSQPEGS